MKREELSNKQAHAMEFRFSFLRWRHIPQEYVLNPNLDLWRRPEARVRCPRTLSSPAFTPLAAMGGRTSAAHAVIDTPVANAVLRSSVRLAAQGPTSFRAWAGGRPQRR